MNVQEGALSWLLILYANFISERTFPEVSTTCFTLLQGESEVTVKHLQFYLFILLREVRGRPELAPPSSLLRVAGWPSSSREVSLAGLSSPPSRLKRSSACRCHLDGLLQLSRESGYARLLQLQLFLPSGAVYHRLCSSQARSADFPFSQAPSSWSTLSHDAL